MTQSRISPLLRSFLLPSLILLWSVAVGWGIAWAVDSSPANTPARFQAGLESYLETCSGCHVPLPPEVMPTQTWKRILERPAQHYGVSVPLVRVSQLVIWQYMNFFSRPVLKDEPVPLYLAQSRYFKALHPNVTLPQPLTHKTCIACHPGALKLDYRTLSPEW